jgi:hypothetical protein
MTLGTIIHWIIATLVFLLGAWVIFLNYYSWLYLGFTKREHHSPAPFIGGVLCSLALFFSPLAMTRAWAWLPPLLDPGCIYLIGLFIYSAIVTRGFK